jgi:hypothetical protein
VGRERKTRWQSQTGKKKEERGLVASDRRGAERNKRGKKDGERERLDW